MKDTLENQNLPETAPLFGLSDIVLELEKTMTECSMAYHYAMMAMEKKPSFDLERDSLDQQMEKLKTDYIDARERLLKIDGVRLADFELDLRRQKAAMFQDKDLLH